jgi:hypothetical protein
LPAVVDVAEVALIPVVPVVAVVAADAELVVAAGARLLDELLPPQAASDAAAPSDIRSRTRRGVIYDGK